MKSLNLPVSWQLVHPPQKILKVDGVVIFGRTSSDNLLLWCKHLAR